MAGIRGGSKNPRKAGNRRSTRDKRSPRHALEPIVEVPNNRRAFSVIHRGDYVESVRVGDARNLRRFVLVGCFQSARCRDVPVQSRSESIQ